jgi:hypothetical protein
MGETSRGLATGFGRLHFYPIARRLSNGCAQPVRGNSAGCGAIRISFDATPGASVASAGPDQGGKHGNVMREELPMSTGPNLRWRLLAPTCLFLAGCVTKSGGDGGSTYHYEYWLPALIVLGGLACVPLGLAVRMRSGRFGWALLIMGPLIGLAIGPSLFLERVHVDARGFEVRSGIWGMTSNANVAFDALRSCRIAQEETGGRRSRQIEVLYFDVNTGPTVRLALNNDVKIEAAKEIVFHVAARGVPMVGFK